MNAMPPPPQQNAGIAMGNPAPLPSQAPRPQQKNPQLDLSQYPDLATALRALKTVQDEKNKNVQQGLQAGAQAQGQPSVIEQLNEAMQRIAGQRMAPQGIIAALGAQRPQAGGVDQLPSGLGDSYAGGGIVAFSGEEGSMVDTKGDPYTHLWRAEGSDTENTPYFESISNAFGLPIEAVKRLIGAPNQKNYKRATAAKTTPAQAAPEYSNEGRNAGIAASKDAEWTGSRLTPEGLARLRATAPQSPEAAQALALYLQKFPDAAPAAASGAGAGGERPSAGIATPAPDITPPAQADWLQKALRQGVEADPRAQADADVKTARDLMGMEPVLAAQGKRADALEALMAGQRDVRSPVAQFLMGMTKGSPQGGLGSLMGSGAERYGTAQQGWAKEDVANMAVINKMRDDIDKARLSGNEALVKTRTQALSDYQRAHDTSLQGAVATENAANQNATSLKTTAMNNAAQLEAARIRTEGLVDAAEARATRTAVDNYGKNIAVQLGGVKTKIQELKGQEFTDPDYAKKLASYNREIDTLTAALAVHNGQPAPAATGSSGVDYSAFKPVKN